MNTAPSRGEYVPHCLYGTGSGRSPEFVSSTYIICTSRDLKIKRIIRSTITTPRLPLYEKSRTSVNNALWLQYVQLDTLLQQWNPISGTHIYIVRLRFNTLGCLSTGSNQWEFRFKKKTRVRTAKTITTYAWLDAVGTYNRHIQVNVPFSAQCSVCVFHFRSLTAVFDIMLKCGIMYFAVSVEKRALCIYVSEKHFHRYVSPHVQLYDIRLT